MDMFRPSPWGAALLCALALQASAQTAPPPVPRGPLSDLGDDLRERGVSLGVVLFSGQFRNPSTGISPGHSANFGMVYFNVGLDLEKIAGLRGTDIHISEVLNKPSYNTGTYLFQTGSGFTPFPVINKTTDLARFTVGHRTLDNRLRLDFGRMNLNREFMVLDMCAGCLFSAPATVMNQPGVSKSSWGATARYRLDEASAVGVGVLEDNAAMWQRTTGWQWRHDTATGYIGIANYTAQRGFDRWAYPYRLETGLFHTTARYDDPLYNTDGTSHVLQPAGTLLQHAGKTGAYFQGRKVYWRPGAVPGAGGRGAPENLAAYGGAVYTAGAGESYPIEAYVGTEWSGFMQSNPAALVGSTLRYIQLGKRRALYEQQARAGYTSMLNMMSGGAIPVVDQPVSRNMFALDLHGRIGLVPGVFVESAVQYLKNPNAMIPATQERIRSGYMFSISLLADFGALSGLSRLPANMGF
jgi:porin